MYKKRDKAQLTMDEFYLPFGDGLDANNRWVKIARIIPWDFIEEEYAKNFSEESGRPSIPSRIAFGASFIKEQENLTDEGTVSYLCENPYAQYLVGLKAFRKEPLFDSSMMVHFRKRFTPEMLQQVNELMYERAHPADENKPDDKDEPPEGGGGNKGVLILDATVAPADIKYPTDLGLVNDCRENTEKLIEKLWEFSSKTGHKTAYNRRKARRNYLKVAKQRKAKLKATRRAIGEQLDYVGKNLETLSRLKEEAGENRLSAADKERLETIGKVYEQQRFMHDTGTRSCPDRIVSLRQPHIRCVVRGKAGRPYEFGQKLHLSVVNGFTFIEDQSYDNYNEGVRLQAAAQRYKDRLEEASDKRHVDYKHRRTVAKGAMFGILYGIHAKGLMRNLKATANVCLSEDECARYIKGIKARYPGLAAWQGAVVARAKTCMYAETALGRRRYLPGIRSLNYGKRGMSERMAINTPVQGLAADCLKLSMARLVVALADQPYIRPLMTVHDSLVFEARADKAKEACRIIRECMEALPPLEGFAPLVAELAVGERYGELEELEVLS